MTVSAVVAVVVLAPTPAHADRAPEGRKVALTIVIPDTAVARDVEAFLCDRAQETFGADCHAAATAQAWEVGVSLRWQQVGRIAVHIQDEAGVLASRVIEVEDPGAAKLTLWLLLRATLRRALAEPGRVPANAAARRADGVSAPRVGTLAAPAVSRSSVTEVAAPVPSGTPGAVGFAVVAGVFVEDPRLFALGPSFSCWWQARPGLVVGADLGYRLAPGVVTAAGDVGLVIHHVPVGVMAGLESDGPVRFGVGLAATADPKVPVAKNQARVVVGVETGLYGQLRLPLTRSDSHFLLRARVAGRNLRQRYRVAGGEIAERPWNLGLDAGVSWQ
ncbi:MAG: hypothetical protein HY903_05430 [Deltaproteobacteria bacterium]|nr:hypothetical protein [Deltaproteobacteria bacterium]